MKTILSLVALIVAFQSPAIAGTLADLNGAQYGLNQASPNMMAVKRLGTKVLRESLRSVELTYSFGIQGGASTAISLYNPDTGHAATLPKTAIVRNCVVDVVTQPTSGGSATVALSTGQGAGDLLAATAIASLTTGLHACVPVGTAATSIKLTADSKPVETVAVAPLTAGEIHVIVDYSMSE